MAKPTSEPSAGSADVDLGPEHGAALRVEDSLRESRTTDPKTVDSRTWGNSRSIEQLVFGGDLGVEELRVVVGVAAAARRSTAQPPGVFGPDAAPIEVERRADAALGERAHLGVAQGAERPRLAEGADHAVLVDAVAAFGVRVVSIAGIARAQADRREQVDARFLPHMLRRVISKKPRGATSTVSVTTSSSSGRGCCPTSSPPP